MNLRKSARKVLEALPKCAYVEKKGYKETINPSTGFPCIDRDGIPIREPIESPPCQNPATIKFFDTNIDMGWADRISPGYLRCDAHTADVDPKRRKEDLPQADLIRELAAGSKEDRATCGACGCEKGEHQPTMLPRGMCLTWCGKCNQCDGFCNVCGLTPCKCGRCAPV